MPAFGFKHTKESKIKMSISRTGDKNHFFGKNHTEKTRLKMVTSWKTRPKFTEETLKKMSESKKGDKNSNFGKHLSEEAKQKISNANTGKKTSEETRVLLSVSRRGDKNPHWLGGISFEPYCIKWTHEFRERVRKFFGYKCVLCGSTSTHRLCVHHINYNKSSCCTDVKPLFVTLCRSCHSKTNRKREYYEQHFTEMITNGYDGKCYLGIDEIARSSVKVIEV